jgi:hypothetical protein
MHTLDPLLAIDVMAGDRVALGIDALTVGEEQGDISVIDKGYFPLGQGDGLGHEAGPFAGSLRRVVGMHAARVGLHVRGETETITRFGLILRTG